MRGSWPARWRAPHRALSCSLAPITWGTFSSPHCSCPAWWRAPPKPGSLRSIAEAVESGALNFRRIARASDEAAQAELVAVKGIGPWTADVYLMFCLGRWDVFPHADIGLSEAYRMISGERKRHPPKKFLKTGERWRPYRGVAAHMLWSYINAARDAERGGA